MLILGEVVQSTKGPPAKTSAGLSIIGCLNPGYDGSLFDCIRRLWKCNSGVVENGLIKRGRCGDFSSFTQRICSDLGMQCHYISSSDNHAFNIIKINGEKRVFDFTRMIAIRDDYHNFTGQEIDDWFDMPLQKMFEYKPKREIRQIDDKRLGLNPITKDNYTTYFSDAQNCDSQGIER